MTQVDDGAKLAKPVCADCIAFRREHRDGAGVSMGKCRLRLELGVISSELNACHLLQVRAERLDKVDLIEHRLKPPKHSRSTPSPHTKRKINRTSTLSQPVTGDVSGEINMDRDGLKQVLRELLEEETLYGYPEMGERWEEGTLVLKPADSNLQPKEVPIKTFFHKIVMLRDRLRVLEAKVNAHDKLEGQEKLELQGYISKCYGTLTTFNILFADKEDHFSSK